jgi:hypothetical protein
MIIWKDYEENSGSLSSDLLLLLERRAVRETWKPQ